MRGSDFSGTYFVGAIVIIMFAALVAGIIWRLVKKPRQQLDPKKDVPPDQSDSKDITAEQDKHPYRTNPAPVLVPRNPTKIEIKALKGLRRRFAWHGLNTFDSWSGFGVVTDWPQPRYKKQEELIPALCKKKLPDNYFYCGPEMAAGGAMVFYIWRKDDPRLKNYLRVDVEDYIRDQK